VRGSLPVVDEVQIAGLKRVNPAYPGRYLKNYDGAPVDVDRVDKDMGLILATASTTTSTSPCCRPGTATSCA
jgi:hypothetical protein